MTLEDRVVTTSILQRFAEETSGALAIPAGLLGRLPADGMHVLVPRGRAPVPGEVLMCEIHLDTGGADPTRMPILVPLGVWGELPTAFAVIAAASRLVPSVVRESAQRDLDALVLESELVTRDSHESGGEGW